MADLSIGERDARLLQLRALVLGAHAEGFAECPRCAERVEFPLDTAAFAARRDGFRALPLFRGTRNRINGTAFRFRLPTSRDLARGRRGAGFIAGSAALDGELRFRPDDSTLPDEIIEAVSRRCSKPIHRPRSPSASAVPPARHQWESLFDIADFFWTEISVQAQRLLREIDALARAYGWTEHEILSLPAQRRQSYLEMLAA